VRNIARSQMSFVYAYPSHKQHKKRENKQ